MEGYNENHNDGNEMRVILPEQPAVVQDAPARETLGNIHGLSEEEKRDPNRITVTISDTQAPIILLFGPSGCGKTMTLIRLTRYLQNRGYTLVPDASFRPSQDRNYEKLCNDFPSIVNSDDAAARTDHISFMLVKIIKDGRTICQLLEGPGELYFNPSKAKQDFPTFVHRILNNTSLRKIFIFFVEPNFMDEENRRNYVSTMLQIKQSTDNQKFVFLANKVDKSPATTGPGKVNISALKHQIECDYPSIFVPFVNNNPITSFWRKNNYEFVPFQTGTYTKDGSGALIFNQGSDRYPQMLWEKLEKLIRG